MYSNTAATACQTHHVYGLFLENKISVRPHSHGHNTAIKILLIINAGNKGSCVMISKLIPFLMCKNCPVLFSMVDIYKHVLQCRCVDFVSESKFLLYNLVFLSQFCIMLNAYNTFMCKFEIKSGLWRQKLACH